MQVLIRAQSKVVTVRNSGDIKPGDHVKFKVEEKPGENNHLIVVLEVNGDRCLIEEHISGMSISPTRTVKTVDLKKENSVDKKDPEMQKEFDKEKKEHPEFTDAQIWQIVEDHASKHNAKNEKTWPSFYECNFLEQGLVSYEDVGQGIALLKKETIDKMIPSFIGKPVIDKRHRDISPDNYEQFAVGYITDIWFDAATGWYRCKFILTDPKARESIENGYGVSCSFKVSGVGSGGEWHAMKYSEEIVKGEGEHLAIVDTPRYEECRIFANSKAAKIDNGKSLSAVNLNGLDDYEIRVYEDMIKKGRTKEDALKIIINTVEGDSSQLSKELAGTDYAKQMSNNSKTNKNGGNMEKIDNANLDILSPIQLDKYLDSLTDAGLQGILDGEHSGEIKTAAKMHMGNREKLALEAQAGGGGAEKKKEASVDKKLNAEEAFVMIGDKEVSVADLIKENAKLKNDLEELKDPALKNAAEEKAKEEEELKKKNEADLKAKEEEELKKKNEAEELKKKEEDLAIKKANEKKDPKWFVKLNSIKEQAQEITDSIVDTLKSKIDRGNSRYGSK
jgi:Uncharacterized protein conserved in bacteria (DUF2213)